MKKNMYSKYYQAAIVSKDLWFVTAIIRSFEHLELNRTIDVKNSILEFFVPEGNEKEFLEVMVYFQDTGLVTSLQELPNRLSDESQEV